MAVGARWPGRIISDSLPVRRMVSIPGTAGHQVHNIMEYSYPLGLQGAPVMHSDGLADPLVSGCRPGAAGPASEPPRGGALPGLYTQAGRCNRGRGQGKGERQSSASDY